MTISVVPTVSSVTAVTGDLENLLTVCQTKGDFLGAAWCLHYQDGYLFSADKHRAMLFKMAPAFGCDSLPKERYAICGTEIADLIKDRSGRIQLDFAAFENREGSSMSRAHFLDGYEPRLLSFHDYTKIRKLLSDRAMSGKDIAWQFVGSKLVLSTGTDQIYTVGIKHSLDADYFGTTPIVAFKTKHLSKIPAWSRMSMPDDQGRQVFSHGDRMYYVVMPFLLKSRPTIDIAFKYAVDID